MRTFCGRKAGVSSFDRDGEQRTASHGIADLPLATQLSRALESSSDPTDTLRRRAFPEQDWVWFEQ
jgi:hypothetical protein